MRSIYDTTITSSGASHSTTWLNRSLGDEQLVGRLEPELMLCLRLEGLQAVARMGEG